MGFALPTLFGLLFQQFYNMVDTMIVGKLLGAQALAAVGSTSSINFFVIGFCMGVCSGFAIPVAQRMGAGDFPRCAAMWPTRLTCLPFLLLCSRRPPGCCATF
ncbi:MAG: MATE family efflux transporter [Lawsonibacter sp.]